MNKFIKERVTKICKIHKTKREQKSPCTMKRNERKHIMHIKPAVKVSP